jgi:hypothetical protein
MRSTLLKWFLVPAVAAVAMLASQTASAERVNVPFSFSAMGKAFPAGSYIVEQDPNGNFVTLETLDCSKTLVHVIGPGGPDSAALKVVLRFNVNGEDYQLDTIQIRSKITTHMTKNHSKDRERVVTGM